MKRMTLAAAAMIATAGTAFAQEEPTGSWADETSAYYFARGGSATDGTYLYLFGGYQLGVSSSYPSYYRRARRYDPANNAWTTLANLPIVESSVTYQYNAGACFNGQLYSFGTAWQEGNGIVLSYSIANDAWSELDGVTLPGARYAAAAAVLGNRIYIAGGYSDGPSSRVDEFNPANNTFTQVADLPVGLHRHAMAAVPARGSLFVVGGMSADGYEATCSEYSPSTNTWTARAPITVDGVIRPRAYLAAFTVRNRIYATGGRSDAGTSPAVFEYHPASDAWHQRASMASPRYQHAAVAIAGRGYVYGGLPVYTEGEEFTPPDFGPAPDLESMVVQAGIQPESSLQAKEDPTVRDGWMGRMVSFSAVISDPDPGQQVRLRIRIRQLGEPLWNLLDSGLVGQGPVAIYYSLPTKGRYDWEYRIEDADENSYPAEVDAWLPAFGNSFTPDLRCDPTPPTAPVPHYPDEFDAAVGDPDAGDVIFGWTDGSDDGPASGLMHDIEIARWDEPKEPELKLSFPAGVGTAAIRLPVADYIRSWRLRSRDIAGNVSRWSRPLRFRVTYDDRINHAAGDGRATCGFGPGRGPSAGAFGLLAALAIGGSIVHSRRRAARRGPMKY